MKSNDLKKIAGAINYVDDDLISAADDYIPTNRKKINFPLKWTAAAAFLIITALVFSFSSGMLNFKTVKQNLPENDYSTLSLVIINNREYVRCSSSPDYVTELPAGYVEIGEVKREIIPVENKDESITFKVVQGETFIMFQNGDAIGCNIGDKIYQNTADKDTISVYTLAAGTNEHCYEVFQYIGSISSDNELDISPEMLELIEKSKQDVGDKIDDNIFVFTIDDIENLNKKLTSAVGYEQLEKVLDEINSEGFTVSVTGDNCDITFVSGEMAERNDPENCRSHYVKTDRTDMLIFEGIKINCVFGVNITIKEEDGSLRYFAGNYGIGLNENNSLYYEVTIIDITHTVSSIEKSDDNASVDIINSEMEKEGITAKSIIKDGEVLSIELLGEGIDKCSVNDIILLDKIYHIILYNENLYQCYLEKNPLFINIKMINEDGTVIYEEKELNPGIYRNSIYTGESDLNTIETEINTILSDRHGQSAFEIKTIESDVTQYGNRIYTVIICSESIAKDISEFMEYNFLYRGYELNINRMTVELCDENGNLVMYIIWDCNFGFIEWTSPDVLEQNDAENIN